ncbi:MAG: hypothetical protein ACRDMV_10865 [Streptosporangiales bacterium]
MPLTLARHRYWWTPATDASHLTYRATPHCGDVARTACGRYVTVTPARAPHAPCVECQELRRDEAA